MENFSQALRKISALSLSEAESSFKPNSIAGLKRSTARYPKTRFSHRAIL
jgi:hypothetical protein